MPRLKKVSFEYISTKKVTLILIPLVSAILVFSVIKKAIYLSAGPSKDKDCHLLYPFNTFDPSKVTNIILKNQNNLPFSQKGGNINDISCLNSTPIYGLVKVEKEEDITNAIVFAKENGLKVTPAGVRHSNGRTIIF